MATLTFLLAAFLDQARIVLVVFLDPLQAGIVLALVLLHRGLLSVIVAGVVAAVVSETVMALAADGYTWGELFAPRMVASLLQGAVLWGVVRLVRSMRIGGSTAARGAGGGVAGNAVATLGSLGGGAALPGAPHAQPLHARAHLRRRASRLRIR